MVSGGTGCQRNVDSEGYIQLITILIAAALRAARMNALMAAMPAPAA